MDVLDDTGTRESIWAGIREFAERYLRPFRIGASLTVGTCVGRTILSVVFKADRIVRPTIIDAPILTAENAFSASVIAEAEQRLGIRLPEALVEFYQAFGRARHIWCVQDEWLPPGGLVLKNGVLRFCYENQGCWQIGIRAEDLMIPDPPVVWGELSWLNGVVEVVEFSALATRVSVFAMNMLADVAKFAQPAESPAIGYSSEVEDVLDAMLNRYSRCQLRNEMFRGPTVYLQSRDTFLEFSIDTNYIYSVFTNSAAVSRFCEIAESFPFEWLEPPVIQ